MSDDFQAFAGNGDRPDTAEPPDGTHTATLTRAKLGTSKAGDRLVICEWQTIDLNYYWTTFHRVDGAAKPFTRELVMALGVDLDNLSSWEQLADVLDTLGGDWLVNVKHNGDFLNVKVLEGRTQTELPVNVPAAPRPTSDFDDTIPF